MKFTTKQKLTVKRLKEILADLPDDYTIYAAGEYQLMDAFEVDHEYKEIDIEGHP
jgi:hypothetical protein